MSSEAIPTSSGIYRIVCITTGRIYVGSAVNLRRRWIEHRHRLRHNTHANTILQNAWHKYGESMFAFEVIELVLLPEMLTYREQYWFVTLNPFGKNGFNILPFAGSRLGTKASPETREKLRLTNRGRKYPKEFGENITKRQLGRKFSDETRKRIGDAQRGKPRYNRRGEKHSPEHIEKQRLALLGYKHTEETRRNMAKAQKGRVHSIESREKRRQSLLNHPVSAETRAKISESNKGRIASAESRAKMSATGKTRQRSAEEYASRRVTIILIDPHGTQYTVTGINDFCDAHGLDGSAIAKVVRGKYKHHRGWTAKYPENAE